jgi:hypothetical protein
MGASAEGNTGPGVPQLNDNRKSHVWKTGAGITTRLFDRGI